MNRREIIVKTEPSYSVYLGRDLLRHSLLAQLCLPQKRRLVLLSDARLSATVARQVQGVLKHSGVDMEIVSTPSGEEHKTREIKQQLEDLLFAKGYGRDSLFLALGGGTITDLVGYLASTYCRGVPWIALPTTLLAMVDAAIGGKTGVNTPYGKNLIGTFYPPIAVVADVAVLNTLPKSEWRNGIVEMIKHACIWNASPIFAIRDGGDEDMSQYTPPQNDPSNPSYSLFEVSYEKYLACSQEARLSPSATSQTGSKTQSLRNLIHSNSENQAILFDQLERSTESIFTEQEILFNLIEYSCQIKKEIVEQDELESGMRELLNFGHTVGHAVEHLEHYALSHGEAIAIGILVEAEFSVRLGLLAPSDFKRLQMLLKSYELPLRTEVFRDRKKFVAQLQLDKKSKAATPRAVLLKSIGEAYCEENIFSFPLDLELLEQTLDWAQKEFSAF